MGQKLLQIGKRGFIPRGNQLLDVALVQLCMQRLQDNRRCRVDIDRRGHRQHGHVGFQRQHDLGCVALHQAQLGYINQWPVAGPVGNIRTQIFIILGTVREGGINVPIKPVQQRRRQFRLQSQQIQQALVVLQL